MIAMTVSWASAPAQTHPVVHTKGVRSGVGGSPLRQAAKETGDRIDTRKNTFAVKSKRRGGKTGNLPFSGGDAAAELPGQVQVAVEALGQGQGPASLVAGRLMSASHRGGSLGAQRPSLAFLLPPGSFYLSFNSFEFSSDCSAAFKVIALYSAGEREKRRGSLSSAHGKDHL